MSETALGDRAGLVDRDSELAATERAVAAVARGEGRVVAIEAPPGMGKTTLLEACAAEAESAGLRVHRATGSALERDLAFGLVRQLLEREAAERDAGAFAGAAALARTVFDLAEGPTGAPPSPDGLHRSIYWLISNLAEGGPMALLVDDAHQGDRESLAALAYAARRIADLPVLIAVAFRPPADPSPELAAISEAAASEAGEAVSPGPLSADGVSAVVGDILGEAPSAEAGEACLEASGGNPQLLRMLAEQMRFEGDPSAGAARRLAVSALSEAAVTRLARLSADAQLAARAAAVLDREATVARVGELTGLADPGAAVDELVTAGILLPALPITFAHPTLQEAVSSQLQPAEGSSMHAKAAALLKASGLGAEPVAAHLLESEPAGDIEAARILRDAGATARRRGSPRRPLAC